MNVVLKKILVFIAVLCVFLQSGCTLLSKNNTGTDEKINLVLASSTLINPNLQYEASPVEINFYELDDIVDFNEASYRELVDGNLFKDKEIKRTQFFLSPNSVIIEQLSVDSKTKYLVAIASFLNIENSQWKLSFFKQKKPFLFSGQNYLNIYVHDLKMMQLSKEEMREKLRDYAKQNPSQKDVDNDGYLLSPKRNYDKGIYRQLDVK